MNAEAPLIFRLPFRVRSYEVEPAGHATELTLQNYLQEAAATHAHELYFSIQRLFPMGLTWLLVRSRLQVTRYPAWRENVTVETWPSGWDGAVAFRDFLFLDQNEIVIARGTSHWLLYDFRRRRPASIAERFPELPAVDRTAIERDVPGLGAVETAEYTATIPSSWLQMDMNGHANNAAYIQWAMAPVPEAIRKEWVVFQMDTNYLKEVFADTTVTSRVQVVPQGKKLEMIHEIVNTQHRPVMRVYSQWRRRTLEEQQLQQEALHGK